MPNFKVTGLNTETVKKLSFDLSESLSKIIDCPVDWITFSMGATDENCIFCNGQLLKDTIFVYVEWFDRGLDIKNKVAEIINNGIFDLNKGKSKEIETIETVDIIFVNLEKGDYYENGESF